MATEISKSSIANALKNCELNGVNNIKFLRMSAEELISAFGREREFNRLRELDIFSYDFSHVLVDPPRAGLDASVINFIKNYENIVYISCSPQNVDASLQKHVDSYHQNKNHSESFLSFFHSVLSLHFILCSLKEITIIKPRPLTLDFCVLQILNYLLTSKNSIQNVSI